MWRRISMYAHVSNVYVIHVFTTWSDKSPSSTRQEHCVHSHQGSWQVKKYTLENICNMNSGYNEMSHRDIWAVRGFMYTHLSWEAKMMALYSNGILANFTSSIQTVPNRSFYALFHLHNKARNGHVSYKKIERQRFSEQPSTHLGRDCHRVGGEFDCIWGATCCDVQNISSRVVLGEGPFATFAVKPCAIDQ